MISSLSVCATTALLSTLCLFQAAQAQERQMDPSWARGACDKPTHSSNVSLAFCEDNRLTPLPLQGVVSTKDLEALTDPTSEGLKAHEEFLKAHQALENMQAHFFNNMVSQSNLLKALVSKALSASEEKISTLEAQLSQVEKEQRDTRERLAATQFQLVTSEQDFLALNSAYEAHKATYEKQRAKLNRARRKTAKLSAQLSTLEHSLCAAYDHLVANTGFWDYLASRLFGSSAQCAEELQYMKGNQG